MLEPGSTADPTIVSREEFIAAWVKDYGQYGDDAAIADGLFDFFDGSTDNQIDAFDIPPLMATADTGKCFVYVLAL